MISQSKRICLFATLLTMAFAGDDKFINHMERISRRITHHNRIYLTSCSGPKALDLAGMARLDLPRTKKVMEHDIKSNFKPLENMNFDFSFLGRDYFEQVHVLLPEWVETPWGKSELLDRLHDAEMADGLPAGPIHVSEIAEQKTIFKIVGLTGATKYNDCMGRVTGYYHDDENTQTRWNMEIEYEGERKILAIKPECLVKTTADEAEKATDTLNGILIGDTVRFAVDHNLDWNMGLVTKENEKSLSFEDTETEETLSWWPENTEFVIAPFNGGKSIVKSIANLTLVTPDQIELMTQIAKKTEGQRGEIESYIAKLNNGDVTDILDFIFSKMEEILKIYDEEEYKNIAWRKDEMLRKLQRKIEQMERKLPINRSKAYARFARIAVKQLENMGMSLEEAREAINKEDQLM